MKKTNNKYHGMGFAESLIALMIAGVVGIVLMRISSSTLRELAQLDIQDAIAKHAVSTAVNLQKVAIQDMALPDEEKQFSDLQTNLCYNINEESNIDTENTVPCPTPENNRPATYSKIFEDSQETPYFRIMRVKENEENRAIIEIIVGVSDMAGLHTTNKDIKDFTYLVVIAK